MKACIIPFLPGWHLTKLDGSVIFFFYSGVQAELRLRGDNLLISSYFKVRKDLKMGTKAKKDSKNKTYSEIKRDLEKQRTTLLTEAGVIIGSGINQNQENLPDVGDQASAVADQNFLLRLKEREQKLLKKIDEALARINQGNFGICESCGEEIGYKRLKARPVTTLCIECKTQQEKEEKTRQ